MLQILTRLLRILLGIALILLGFNPVAQAQSLPPAESAPVPPSAPETTSPSPPPSDTVNPPSSERPRARRRFRPQIGVGGNIGVTGQNTGLSSGGVVIFNRTDFNDYLSIRGSNVLGGERQANTLALTFNFPIRSAAGDVKVAPFVGGGALISSKYGFDDLKVRGLVTSGIDIPVTKRLTATTSANIGFTDRANLGVQFGLMYRF